MPGSRPSYEVLSKEGIEGPIDFREVKTRVDSGQYTLNDSLREKGRSKWEPIRAALQKERAGTMFILPISGMIFVVAGSLAVWCGFQSFVPGSGFSPPSHAPGTIGVIMIAVGVGLGLLAYNIHAVPFGKWPRKWSAIEVGLYWGFFVLGLLAVLQFP